MGRERGEADPLPGPEPGAYGPTMAQRFAETERKYAAPAATTANPDLTSLTPATRALPALHLDALYFDTPAFTLTAHRITLRRRDRRPRRGLAPQAPHLHPGHPHRGPRTPHR